jgi:4-hydroxy-tetrahydrodipicolinate synthase
MARADARGMSKTTMSTPATPGPASAAFTGMYVPLVTPFDAEGAVAFEALERLAHEVLDAGASGLVALGTTAEPASLTPGEQSAVQERIARVCRERAATMMVGASTVRAVQALHGTQAAAALSLVPPFQRPGEAGTVAHFEALAAASPVPLIVYHVPYRTGQPLSAAAIRQLARIPGIAGIKYAAGTIDATAVDLLTDPPPGFSVLGGDDALISPLLALGAHGGILASAHLATRQFADLATAWSAGDAATAQGLGRRLAPLSAALFAEPNPTVIKAVLHARGRIPTPDVRLPLLPAAPASLATATKYLDA